MNTQRNMQREWGKAGLSALRGPRVVQKVNQHHMLFFTCIIEDQKIYWFILNFLFSGKKIGAACDFPAVVVIPQMECNDNEENWKDKDSKEQQSRWKNRPEVRPGNSTFNKLCDLYWARQGEIQKLRYSEVYESDCPY